MLYSQNVSTPLFGEFELDKKQFASLDLTKPTCNVEGILSTVVAACFKPGGLSESQLKACFVEAKGEEFKGSIVARKETPEEVASWDVYATV
jgi:hypothetical protein